MMKRIYLIIILCFALIGQAQAQRYLPGQKGIQATGGFVDGFAASSFFASAGLSTYTKNGNRWVFGAEYLQKGYTYDGKLIPVSQITAEGGYYKQLLSDPSKTISFSIGASAIAGYESVNWGKKLLSDGATITGQDNFLYGGAVSFEIETFLSDKFALLVNVRERVLLGSSVNKFHTQIGAGVKIIIN